MTDLQFLLLALTIIYLSECICWVRRGSVVFRQWFLAEKRSRRGADAAHPSPGIGAHRTGIVPLNPLPPFGTAFVVHQWPISMTSQAACAFVSTVINGNERPEFTGACVHWDDIWKIERDGEVIHINGKFFARCNHEPLACLVERVLRRIQAAPAPRREREIGRWLDQSTNLRRIRRDLRRFRLVAGAGAIRWNAHLLLLVIFGLIPAAIGLPALRPWLLSSLLLLAGLLLIQGISFFYAHRRLYPQPAGGRWRSTLTMIFTPTASIRACDPLARDLLAAYQPLAVALVLCKGPRQRAFARQTLLDLLHPMQPAFIHDEPLERATIGEFHQEMLERSTDLLEQAGYDIAELTGAPIPQDTGAISYCPRCDGEFLIASGVCEHCGGVKLHPLHAAAAATEAQVH